MSESMRVGAVLERRSDGVLFKVISLGHWSSICAESGEVDSVKWFGFDGERAAYVSASKGYTYLLI
jgi:hypothetical protein